MLLALVHATGQGAGKARNAGETGVAYRSLDKYTVTMMDALTTLGVDELHDQSMNVARTASTKNTY